MPKERVLIADLFRVIAIFLVILSHILITIGSPQSKAGQASFGVFPFYWNTWGEVGITLFLIVSGFGLGYKYRGGEIKFTPFFINRIVRIYPVYYFSLLFALIIQIAFAIRGSLVRDQAFVLLPGFSCFDFILALTGMNAFFGKWGGDLVGASWFVGLIMSMYLLFPLISDGLRRSPWLCMIFLFVISSASRLLIADSRVFTGNPMLWFPLNRVFEFSTGVALGQLIRPDLLTRLNTGLRKIPFLFFLSELSFPLFLIHDPLRRFITWEPQPILPLVSGILVFLVLSIVVSIMALESNKRIKSIIPDKYLPQFG